jgi:hypothetical protein
VGFHIIPETTAPILVIFILSNFIQNKLEKKPLDYLYFFWLGILSIFYSDLYYLLYAIFSILFFIYSENSSSSFTLSSLHTKLKENYKQLTLGSALVILLFIFFPRFHNFLPKSSTVRTGQIGYSKDVNNSNSTSIQLSTQTAFYAEINEEQPSSILYWRGRVNDITDGYNWRANDKAHSYKFNLIKSTTPDLFVKLKYEQDFDGDLILLNSPAKIIKANLNYYHEKATNTYRSYSKKKKGVIYASSTSEKNIEQKYSKRQLEELIKLPGFTPKIVKNIFSNIHEKRPLKIINLFKRYLLKHKFSYTLAPGNMPTLKDFIKNKKGYCTHFASFLGVVLRYKGIPTRLVSGFQGGTFNELGSYYTVKSNDAHVWVEYYYKDRWHSIDPTAFVSPSRVTLGGQQFFTQSDTFFLQDNKRNFFFKNLYYAKQYLDNLNYKVSLFFDNFDKVKQNEISKSLRLEFKQFFILGLALILIVIAFIYMILRKKITKHQDECVKLLRKLDNKLKKTRSSLSDCVYLFEMESLVRDLEITQKNKSELFEILKEYERSKYSRTKDINNLKLLIKNFKLT